MSVAGTRAPVRAAALRAPRAIEVRALELGAPAADEAIVRVVTSGVCGTDVEIYEGHVTVACGRCSACREDAPNLCLRGGLLGRDLDGLFADRARVPAANCYPLPDAVR